MLDWGDDRPGVCPNGLREEGETCDGTDLGGQTCEGLEYTGGTLTCRDDCTLDTGACTLCGNGIAEGEEECDGEDYGDVTCASLGFYGGQINCSDTCYLLTTDCQTYGRCGDSQIQVSSGEVCDQDNLDGRSCSDEEKWAGDLSCNEYCNQIISTGCSGIAFVSSGSAHTCLTDDLQMPFCWGANTRGQSAAPTGTMATRPVWLNVVDCQSAPRILAGFESTCIFCDDTWKLWCFGDNRQGQLGLGDQVDRSVPVAIEDPDQLGWAWIAIGATHLCATVGDGEPYCAGSNARGQLGTGGLTDSLLFAPVVKDPGLKFVMLAAGDGFTCGIGGTAGEGRLWCWGRGDRGQLGSGLTDDQPLPVEVTVSGATSFTWITAGADHACALDDTGNAWCWGAGDQGQLGNGTMTDSLTAVAVHMPVSTVYSTMNCSAATCCGQDIQGRLYCWGANEAGQLGIGAGSNRSEPVQAQLPAGEIVQAAAVGERHVCVATITNRVFCWGANEAGQLGQGSTEPSLEPARVIP